MRIFFEFVADTAARLLRLLGLLQRQAFWGGQELADRLGVGTRTVRRDAERLRDLGYLVETTPGPGGGYRLGVGSDLPPLLLDDDEAMAVAVVLGVSAGAAIPGIERAALATLSRVDRLLPPRLRSQLAALRASTVALMSSPDVVPAESLVTLARACDGHEQAMFGYRSRQGERSDRRVEPHWLVATDRRWYLVAHDLDRQEWRTFRVDRIGEIRLTGHIFEPRPLDDPARLVSESIALGALSHPGPDQGVGPRRRGGPPGAGRHRGGQSRRCQNVDAPARCREPRVDRRLYGRDRVRL